MEIAVDGDCVELVCWKTVFKNSVANTVLKLLWVTQKVPVCAMGLGYEVVAEVIFLFADEQMTQATPSRTPTTFA